MVEGILPTLCLFFSRQFIPTWSLALNLDVVSLVKVKNSSCIFILNDDIFVRVEFVI